jgi:hypothetical protein
MSNLGIWCRRAGWGIVILDLVRLLLLLYGIVTNHVSLWSTPLWWNSLFQACLSVCGHALFDFFMLFAAAALIESLEVTEERQNQEPVDL